MPISDPRKNVIVQKIWILYAILFFLIFQQVRVIRSQSVEITNQAQKQMSLKNVY